MQGLGKLELNHSKTRNVTHNIENRQSLSPQHTTPFPTYNPPNTPTPTTPTPTHISALPVPAAPLAVLLAAPPVFVAAPETKLA